MNSPIKRRRGRPAGIKDTKPRKRRTKKELEELKWTKTKDSPDEQKVSNT